MRYAQELLGHQIPSGDVATVLRMALQALIPELERRRFAATGQPRRPTGRPSGNPRHVPAHIRREVWKRDHGRCTFVRDGGRPCEARTGLELDHVQALARGGESTVDNLRLRCRAHNQLEAERTYGAGFMRHKRIAASEARSQGNDAQGAPAPPPARRGISPPSLPACAASRA